MSVSFPHFSSCTIVPRQRGDYLGLNTFTSHPSPQEEKERGTLFGFFLIGYEHRRNDEILDSIVSTLEEEYYGRPFPQEGLEECFEQTIQSINQKILEEIQTERFFLNLNGLHGLIGVIRGKELLFTYRGDVQTLLFHERRDDAPLLIDLIGKSTREHTKESSALPTKVFSQLLSGQMSERESLLVCTKSVTDTVDEETLKTLMRHVPIAEASDELKNILKKNRGTVPFVALALSVAPQRERTSERGGGSEASLENLLLRERETKHLLSTSVTSLLFKQAANRLKQWNAPGYTKLVVSTIGRWSLLLAKYTLKFCRWLVRGTVACTLLLVALAKKQTSVQAVVSDVQERLQTNLRQENIRGLLARTTQNRLRNWFVALPWKQRILVTAGTLTALVFVVSLVTLRIQGQRTLERERFESTWQMIQEKKEKALASIIYQNEEETKMLLAEIQNAVTTLPQNSRDRKERVRTVQNELKELTARVHHIVEPELTRIADLPADNNRPTVLMELNNHLYIATKNNLLYDVNKDNKQVLNIDAAPFLSGELKAGIPLEKNSLLLMDANQQFRELKLETRTIRPLEMTFALASPRIESMTIYNNRLYLLDAQNQQITRHGKISTGFDKGTRWIRDPNPVFNNARALVIDGVAYMLEGNGKIRKFVNGFEREFPEVAVEPRLTEPTTMSAPDDSPTLYISEPKQKRIVVVNKDAVKGPLGKLVMQYTFPSLTNSFESVMVNEKKKTLYLLSGNTLYSAPLTHLQK